MTLSHSEAYEHGSRGYAKIYGHDPSANEGLVICGVSWIESRYGSAWNIDVETWNMGAIQSSAPPCDPATEFLYTDTRPNDDGTSTPYRYCFKRYSTPADGFADFVRVLFKIRNRETVRHAAELGDWYGVSAALYDTVYYQGFGPTREARIENHHRALLSSMARIAASLGIEGPPRTLRLGMDGDDVAEMQRVVGANDDGLFGPETLRAVKAWQEAHGLEPDGIWGPKSRAVAGDAPTDRPPPVPVDDALTVADRLERSAQTLRTEADVLDGGADRLRRAAGHE